MAAGERDSGTPQVGGCPRTFTCTLKQQGYPEDMWLATLGGRQGRKPREHGLLVGSLVGVQNRGMLRDAVRLGITPYGPDQGWTIGGPIDLGARCKTLHPLVFGPFGDFPLWIRWGGVHGVCPLAGPGPATQGDELDPLWGRFYPGPTPHMVWPCGGIRPRAPRSACNTPFGGHQSQGQEMASCRRQPWYPEHVSG